MLKKFNKKRAFTLSEILVTLGLIGAISAITIPNLAYNYRAKVLEEQFRSTYSELKEIGSALNYEKGDVGLYANKANFSNFQKEFMSKISGGNKLMTNSGVHIVTDQIRAFYQQGGGRPGPYYFNLNNSGQLQQTGIICDNGDIWTDNKGRIWTFNHENRIICVDVNGTANPNRLNIDTFAFIPMSAEMFGTWVYDDPSHPNDYSGQIVPCDIDKITSKGWSNSTPPDRDPETNLYIKNNPAKAVAYDACPFFEPMENIAPLNSTKPGKSAKNKTVTANNNYWKDYINYK